MPEEDDQQGTADSPIAKMWVELSHLMHMFYRSSEVLSMPAGRAMLDRLAAMHPEIARAAAEFAAGNHSGAGDTILDLLLKHGVDVDAVGAEEERSKVFEQKMKSDPNWYMRAKGGQPSKAPDQAPPAARPPCLDGSQPLHVHELWLGPYPAENDFAVARDWLTNKDYGGKSAAWWLSNCVTGLPFRIETFNALPGVYSIKPDHGGLVFRLLAVRRGGKVVIIWWGPKTEYNRITSGANLVTRISNMSARPTERISV